MPLAAVLFPQLENFVLFLGGPFVSSYVRIDDVDPSLAALPWLSLAAWADRLIEFLSDAGPLFRLAGRISVLHALGSDLLCDLAKNFSLAGRPGRLLSLDILNEQPSLLALTGSASWDQVRHSLPVSI